MATLFKKKHLELEIDESFPPQHVPRGRCFFVLGLTVNPIFRRRGVASALLSAQVELARKRRCHTLQSIANSLSQRLFEKHEFRVVRPLPHLFADFPDQMQQPVLMQRLLGSGRRT